MNSRRCLLKHMGKDSPIFAYRQDMAGDVAELVEGGKTEDAAWLEVVDAKLAELSAESKRIEQIVADAYAKTPAGKPDQKPEPVAEPVESVKAAIEAETATKPAKDADAEERAMHSGDFKELLRLRKQREAAEREAIGNVDDGAVLKHSDGRRYVMVLPDVDGGGKWRIQRFDANGFSGHMVFNNQDEAVGSALGEGFKTRDDTALERMQGTKE